MWPVTKISTNSKLGNRDQPTSIHDPRYAEVIARLRAARRQAGLTQAELASRLSRTQAYVSKIETCERRIDLIEALDLCSALGVDLPSVLPPSLRVLVTHDRTTPRGRGQR
ncbi:MAG: helix-turn-helix transcriptional regulator [Acidimicrobiales bacterium]